MAHRIFGVVGSLLLLAVGCVPSQERPAFDEFNVLILSIDTLGAEHSGFLDARGAPTPHLASLAADGITFSRAYSTAPWTLPAVASLFTGQMPSTHGMTDPGTRLAAERHTLAEHFQSEGYETAGITSNALLDAKRGYAQGFGDFLESPAARSQVDSSKQVSDLAIEWLRNKRDSRFFLFVHYFDPHYPFRRHSQFDRTSSYDGPVRAGANVWKLRDGSESLTDRDIEYLIGLHHEEIAFTDHHVGRVLEELRALGLYDDTIILVVSDHGEEFMRHGWIGHTRTLYEELLHVPMILKLGDAVPPRVFEMPVSLLDVMPTLMALSGSSGEYEGPGVSLLPFLFGDSDLDAQRPVFGEVSYRFKAPPHDAKTAFKTSLLVGDDKLIHDLPSNRWELYDLAADGEELRDLAGRGRPVEEALKRRLSEWEASRRSATPEDGANDFEPSSKDVERLRELGYLR